MAKREAPTIKTERLVLRRRQEADMPYMLMMFDDDDVRQYLGGYPPRDERAMLQMVRHRTETAWAVTLKDTGEYIGECHLAKIVDNYLGDVGYLFRKEFWGKGYAGEAVTAIVAYCASELKLKRLCALIDDKNERSKKLITKAGFEWIATLPEADFGGRVADVAYYARSLNG